MNDDLIKNLISLAQLDRDATSVYDDALKHVTDDDLRMALTDFRDEHEHHITQISAGIVRLGGQPLEFKVDMMGHAADWFTTLRSVTGQHGALEALRTAEKYHNKRYGEAVTWDVSDSDLRRELGEFFAEEKHHLSYVEGKLSVQAASPS